MFRRLASGVIAHRWLVIAGWVVLAVVVLVASPKLSTFTSNNNSTFLPGSYQSVEALHFGQRYFPQDTSATGLLVVSATDHAALTTSQQAKVASLAATLSHDKIPSVEAVSTSPVALAPDKKVQLVQVVFSGNVGNAGANAAVPVIRQKAAAYLSGTGLYAALTGNEAINVDSTKDFARASDIIGVATVVLILVLLGLVFRSVVIAVLPVVVIGAVHQVAQSLTADLASWFGFVVGPELAPLLVVVMFGVGTDYMVFLLFRYREQLAAGEEPRAALGYALERAGEVIASAAATVMAAFAALLVASLVSLKTLAPGLIVGILLMLFAAMTLVPAVFSLLGHALFWPSQPRPAGRGIGRTSFIATQVSKRPAVVFAVWVLALVALAFGILGYKTTYNQLAELPGSTPSQQAFNTMAEAFPPGYLGPTQVFVGSPGGKGLDPAAVGALAADLGRVSDVAQVVPPQYTASGAQAYIEVLLRPNPYSPSAMSVVSGPLRAAAQNPGVSGATVYVGGTTAQLADVRTALRHDMEHVFPLALAIVAVILALVLRALVGPLYLLFGVVVVYAATLGSTALLFVRGVGWTGLDYTIPIVAYLFVMAIGTDYNILMSSRLREELRSGKLPRNAAHAAVTQGSPAVFSAALILAGTFASLLLTGIQLLAEIGFAVALGVLLAANIMATRVVPTLSALASLRFWWPQRSPTDEPGASAEQLELVPAGGVEPPRLGRADRPLT